MKQSAGFLLFRIKDKLLQVLLVHPGGPFWKNKDEGAWSIPKGEFADNEDPLEAAKRELEEETGMKAKGSFIKLPVIKQKSGKWVHAWAIETDLDPATIKSNEFEIEWPPKSGKKQSFPEIDKAEWFDVEQAKRKINASQSQLVDELQSIIDDR
jgi:predicted NUDIX family NTP pyrophosphohydrolase